MRVSGFTFLRNAVMNGYPFEESIKSLLPLVDEYVIAVGQGEDSTLDRLYSLDSDKVKVIETCWNEKMADRGFVYGQQKMIAQYNCTGDWAFYLEGDEVLHEKDLDAIYRAMFDNLENEEVEALYFDFIHFYGTPQQFGVAGYRKAPRIIRNSIRSIAPDGLFFVVLDKNKSGRYPAAKYAGGSIYHYGHCRREQYTDSKLKQIGKYWGAKHAEFKGYGSIDIAELRDFCGTHPKVMDDWLINHAASEFAQNPRYKLTRRDLRNRIRFWIESTFDLELSKKHYHALD